MKTFTLLMLVAVATVSSVSAQNYNGNQRGNNRQQSAINSRGGRDGDKRVDVRFGNNQRNTERYGNEIYRGNDNRNYNNSYAYNNRNDNNNRYGSDDRRYDNDRRYDRRRDNNNRGYQQTYRRF